MSSVSDAIIKDLARQILQQGAIIDALCDVLVEQGVITDDELNAVIDDYVLDQEKYINQLKGEQEKELDLSGLYFGPIGEC
jgi:hypothetical protein